MSRLDQHVSLVRNKLAAGTFLAALGWALTGFAAVVWAYILADRFLSFHLPRPWAWFFTGLGVSFAGAVAWAIWRRPSRQQAALAIDERLGLKEKFSTALYVRPSSDPFAAAAVRDAEVTADNVSLAKRFPVRWPTSLAFTLLAFAIAFATSFVSPHPLFAKETPKNAKSPAEVDKERQDTRKLLDQAIAKIESTPRTESNKQIIDMAKQEVISHRDNPNLNQEQARRSAAQAIHDMDVIKEKAKLKELQSANAKNQVKTFKSIGPPSDPSSPLAKVQESLADAKFSDAVNELENVVKNFDKMKQPDQEKAAKDMDKLAQKLQDMAKDPKVQQQVQDQLQKMGANQQQMQQLAQQVQQAAGGDKQAQQAVQQMANQIAQNINNNPNLSQQQQQQIGQQVQNLVNQLQQQANNQATAQQMGQAAQAMAKAMQQQAAKNGGNPGGQQPQQQPGGQQQQAQAGGQQQGANPQQGGQGNQQGNQGNQGGQQQAQGPGPNQQQGNQAGAQQPGQGNQQGQGQGQQGDAQAQMQKQLEQMQQAADAAAENAQQQQENANGAGQGNGGQGGGQPGQNGQGGQAREGAFARGDPNNKGNGSGGPGVSDGGRRPDGQEAPAAFKPERSPSHTLDDGKILASTFIKAMSDPGKSKAGLTNVVEAAQKEATDEVDQERISRPAQNVVKKYFDDLKRGTEE